MAYGEKRTAQGARHRVEQPAIRSIGKRQMSAEVKNRGGDFGEPFGPELTAEGLHSA